MKIFFGLKTKWIIPVVLSVFILFSGCAAGNLKHTDAAPPAVTVQIDEPSIEFSVAPATSSPAPDRLKYVFFFIGDGMGFSHKELAADYKGGPLRSDTFPVQGSIATKCLDNDITDSAAAATAFSTGHKTNEGMVAVLPDGSSVKTIVEAVKSELGMSAGIITTTALTHATPACFGAHTASRAKESEIATQFASSGVDFFAGGGMRFFLPKGSGAVKDSFGDTVKSSRKDKGDPLGKFKKSGYKTFIGFDGAKAFASYSPAAGDRVFASFSNYHTPYQTDRAGNKKQNTPSLADTVQKAITLLSTNKNGFFLMTEGGLIDQASHSNDAAGVAYETVELDKAVEQAYEFYKLHPKETLIVVTADHETGNLSLSNPDAKLLKNITISVNQLQHAFKGSNDDFYAVLSKRFNLSRLTTAEKAGLVNAIELQKAGKTSSYYGGFAPSATASSIVLCKRAGIDFGSYVHTGKNTPLSAIGCGSEELKDIKDNAKLGQAIFKLLGLSPS